MKQTVTAATIQLKREVAWAGQRTRLLASLAGVPRSLGRDLGKAIETILGALRHYRSPIEIRFELQHNENGQRLQIGLFQQVQTREANRISEEFNQIVAAAKLLIQDLQYTAAPDGDAGVFLSATLLIDVPTDRPIPSEVASQWGTVLASRNANSALAESQRRLGMLATHLQQEMKRRSDLEQEVAGLKKLNETLELLALVASKTDNAVIIADRQGRIEWTNDSFQRMTGLDLGEVLGVPLVDVMHGVDSYSDVASEFAQAIADGDAISQDVLHRRKSGETFWASLNATPVFDEQGKVTRWIGMAQDVTQQRHDQEILGQAKQRAERASQAKSDFLANVSHEIRTPMNAIIGMVELLLETKLDDAQRDYAAIVHDSSAKLLQLLNDVLDLSKIEAGQLALQTVEFSLNDTLDSAIAPFRPMAEKKVVQMICNKDEGLPDLLLGDPIRLRQIVMNLVGNAVKFTSDGNINIEVRRVSGDEDRVRLRFCVLDTGIGIEPEYLDQIFRPFTQADSSVARQYGGTGLGLAICAELADLMDAKLWAESEVDVGSQFYFECSFLISQSPSTDDDTLFISSDDVEILADNANALRILVADDHSANRLLLRKTLEKCNHLVDEAADGVEAVRMVKAHWYDLLLLDIQMPNTDGVEVVRQLHALADSLPSMPRIVAVTANAMQGDREKYLALGMDDYLAKPISARRLLALITKWSDPDNQMTNIPVSDETLVDANPGRRHASANIQFGDVDTNFKDALGRLEGDRELLVEQMQFLLEDGPILMRDIAESINESDHRRLELAAHRVKGLASAFDAHLLAEISQQLEALSRSDDLTGALPFQSRLTSAYNSFVASIRRFLEDEIRNCKPRGNSARGGENDHADSGELRW